MLRMSEDSCEKARRVNYKDVEHIGEAPTRMSMVPRGSRPDSVPMPDVQRSLIDGAAGRISSAQALSRQSL
jgi:hypothetical protein